MWAASWAAVAPNWVDTVLFVDVDGVLNVAIQDGGKAPILLGQSNIDLALEVVQDQESAVHSRADVQSITRLVSVARRRVDSSSSACYGDFASCEQAHLAEVFVSRLARLIQKAGSGRHVVLSSKWRHRRYAPRVQELESRLSKHLGGTFSFDGRTKQAHERVPADRLKCIGDYLQRMLRDGVAHPTSLRVLVVDDLFVSPLDGWSCGTQTVYSLADVEKYLRMRTPAGSNVSINFVHTYDEWETSEGMAVQIGAGLSRLQTRQVEEFLGRRDLSHAHPDAMEGRSEEALSLAQKTSCADLRLRHVLDATAAWWSLRHTTTMPWLLGVVVPCLS